MSGDLLTLRMMVVSAAAETEQRWREVAALASVPIEISAETAGDAIKPLNRGGFDIVIVDAALPVEARSGTISAARLATPAPLIALLGGPEPEGADIALAPAVASDDVRAQIERCVRMRLPKRALVVDDSRTMRGIIRKILSASRFVLDVSEADEGTHAVETLDSRYDIMLLDCNLPDADGFDILARIKQAAPATVVVMMTATDDDALAGRARDGGADAFLKKPFYPADIDAVLMRIYGAPVN
jgi:DNA-binding response OmpR family regulator